MSNITDVVHLASPYCRCSAKSHRIENYVRYIGSQTATHPDFVRNSRRRVLIGGRLTQLERQYRISFPGVRVDMANVDSSRVGEADAVLNIVSHVSHAAVARVQRQARRSGVPVVPRALARPRYRIYSASCIKTLRLPRRRRQPWLQPLCTRCHRIRDRIDSDLPRRVE
jgi:hypothetical protein